MDNASKALIMAGSVLIAVAIISAALYAYSVFKSYEKTQENILSVTQIRSFNRFYESYLNAAGTIRGIDVINIINKAEDDEITDVSSIPSVLQGEEQSLHYLDTYNLNIEYDTLGQVNKIVIN